MNVNDDTMRTEVMMQKKQKVFMRKKDRSFISRTTHILLAIIYFWNLYQERFEDHDVCN